MNISSTSNEALENLLTTQGKTSHWFNMKCLKSSSLDQNILLSTILLDIRAGNWSTLMESLKMLSARSLMVILLKYKFIPWPAPKISLFIIFLWASLHTSFKETEKHSDSLLGIFLSCSMLHVFMRMMAALRSKTGSLPFWKPILREAIFTSSPVLKEIRVDDPWTSRNANLAMI